MAIHGLPQKRWSRLIVVLLRCAFCGLLAWSMNAATHEKSSQHRSLVRSSRKLQNGTPYNVVLFIAIKYLNGEVASQIETSELKPSNEVALRFCQSVNVQVSRVPRLSSATTAQ